MNATQIVLTGRFKDMLRIIEMHDRHKAYDLRNAATFHALHYAILLGYPCGVGFDEKEPDWPVVYIDLPNIGQISWHTPGYPGEWDGHTSEMKYERIWTFLKNSDG